MKRLTFSLLLAALPSHAAKYELLEEWPGVTFNDGSKDVTLFLHMQDLDVPDLDIAEASASSDPYVPLYELAQTGLIRRGEDVESIALASAVTPYKLYIKLDEHHKHLIKKTPDFKTSVGNELTHFGAVAGLKISNPKNVLVIVKPAAAPQASPKSLNEVELAVINSLDEKERAVDVSECQGEPMAPASLDCWREKAQKTLQDYKAQKTGPDFTPFERRYIQQRLSAKGYQQFQKSFAQSQSNGTQLKLVEDWHEFIINNDIKSAAPQAPAPAAAVPPPPIPQKPAPAKNELAAKAAPRPAKPAPAELAAPPLREPETAFSRRWVALLSIAAVAAGLALVSRMKR